MTYQENSIIQCSVKRSTAKKIRKLGVEGIYLPIVHSSSEVKSMVIDLGLIRDIKCDIDEGELHALLVETNIPNALLETTDYIYLNWKRKQ